MGETITLPKSGLTIGPFDQFGYASLGQLSINVRTHQHTGEVAVTVGNSFSWGRSIEDAIDFIDSLVLETRAALTPPGHVLVGPDARETVARELWEFNRVCEWTEATEDEKTDYLLGADAVLRAIGVRGGA